MKKIKVSLVLMMLFSLLAFPAGFSHASDKGASINPQANNSITPFGTGSWDFNSTSSTLTLSNSTITVYSNPGKNDEPNDKYNYVLVELLKSSNGTDFDMFGSYILSGTKSESKTITGLTGTYRIKVSNFNYPWLPGTFTVIW
ncbi:hypothetical protein JCM10914A_46140 [Paenibacillus sp. JCM 10914]|uniref:hypothetical protein n=1 Tax=Paenibacillus sp. JCM 10914 TaxID=1236974 RepID=UPI000A4FE283|nr:hypothetical protein [Paenibacillus sp. JCM 10914]